MQESLDREELIKRLKALAESNSDVMVALRLVPPVLTALTKNVQIQSFSENMVSK